MAQALTYHVWVVQPNWNSSRLAWLDWRSGHRMDGGLLWRKLDPAAKRLT